jgi:hypothetical protein
VDEPSLAPFVVRRQAGRWLFFPRGAFAGLATGLFAVGGAFMIYLATIFFRPPASAWWIGVGFFAVAAYSLALAAWTWRRRRTPLSVEADGRVSYGTRELAPASSVRAVCIAEARGGNAGDCEITMEVAGGRSVSLPNPYFSGYSTREQARPLATKLAEALRVPLRNSA